MIEPALHHLIFDWAKEDDYLRRRVKPCWITTKPTPDSNNPKPEGWLPPLEHDPVWGLKAACGRWMLTIHPDHVRMFQGPWYYMTDPDFFQKVKEHIKYDLDRCDHAETLYHNPGLAVGK